MSFDPPEDRRHGSRLLDTLPTRWALATKAGGQSFRFEPSANSGLQPTWTIGDPDHSEEYRYLTTGYTKEKRLVIVAHTYRAGRIRIISARRATRHERRTYEEGD